MASSTGGEGAVAGAKRRALDAEEEEEEEEASLRLIKRLMEEDEAAARRAAELEALSVEAARRAADEERREAEERAQLEVLSVQAARRAAEEEKRRAERAAHLEELSMEAARRAMAADASEAASAAARSALDSLDRTFECPICTDRQQLAHAFWVAQCGHRVCLACMLRTLAMRDGVNGRLLCPHPGPNDGAPCNAPVRSPEICEILENAFGLEGYPADPRALLHRMEMREVNDAYKDSGERVPCRGYDCDFFVLLAEAGAAQNIECGACHQTFCCKCRELAHYGIACDEVARVRSDWRVWVDRDSQQHRQRMAAEDERSKRLAEFNNDEALKEQSCRLCPKCNNCIWKVAGYVEKTDLRRETGGAGVGGGGWGVGGGGWGVGGGGPRDGPPRDGC